MTRLNGCVLGMRYDATLARELHVEFIFRYSGDRPQIRDVVCGKKDMRRQDMIGESDRRRGWRVEVEVDFGAEISIVRVCGYLR